MLGPRSGWLWLTPGYLSLFAFLADTVAILRGGEMVLTRVSREVQGRLAMARTRSGE